MILSVSDVVLVAGDTGRLYRVIAIARTAGEANELARLEIRTALGKSG